MAIKTNHQPRRRTLILQAAALCAVVALMLFSRLCTRHEASTPDDRAGGDTINVAIEISPIGVNLSGDTLSGYYYDMLQQIMQQHNRPVAINVFNHSETALKQLLDGRYDVIIADLPVTTAIKDSYLTTIPLIVDNQVLVQAADTTGGQRTIAITSPSQLAGGDVYLPARSSMRSRLENLAAELGDTINIIEDLDYGAEQLMMMVALGQIPNVVVNSRAASLMLARYPNLDASVPISFSQFQGWILAPRDSVLRDTLDVWLQQYQQSPAADALEHRYFGQAK